MSLENKHRRWPDLILILGPTFWHSWYTHSCSVLPPTKLGSIEQTVIVVNCMFVLFSLEVNISNVYILTQWALFTPLGISGTQGLAPVFK